MGEKHPKRRRDKYNPYRISQKDRQYFLTFKDGEGVLHDVEINEPLYDIFNRFELEDISYLNVWDRHMEHSELTEETFNRRALSDKISTEETVIKTMQKELLHKAISELPDIQRRRLILYYFMRFTYEQIAEMEGCTKTAVKKSVDRALDKLRNKFSK